MAVQADCETRCNYLDNLTRWLGSQIVKPSFCQLWFFYLRFRQIRDEPEQDAKVSTVTHIEIRVPITAEGRGAFDNHTGNIKADVSWKT